MLMDLKITITCHGKTKTVAAQDNESFLEIALKAGMEPPYSCLEGVCGTCQAQVEKGELNSVEDIDSKPPNLIVKTCMTRPKSDATINYDKI